MYITLIDEEDVTDGMELIQAKSQQEGTVEQVCLTLYLPLHQLAPDSLSHFFRCIHTQLPGTSLELRLTKDQNHASPVNVLELAKLLQEAPNLSLLEIDVLGISGGNVACLGAALKSQVQLRTVYMNEIEHVHAHGNLQPLADALCSLPRLETLEVYQVCFAKNSAMNARALSSIARHSKAKSLEVMPCPHHNFQEQGLAVTGGLRANRVLQKLRLTTCTFPKRFMFQDEVIASLGCVLQDNPFCPLQSLELNVCESINLLPFAHALTTNRTLTNLVLCWDTPSLIPDDKNMTALRRVIRDQNYVLERLDITLRNDLGPPVDPELHFYLQLNRMGRKHLLGRNGNDKDAASRDDWIDRLSACEDDLSAVYYFLSHNPLLCSCESAIIPTDTKSKKHDCPVIVTSMMNPSSPARTKRHCSHLR